MGAFIDLTGLRYGRLSVIERVGSHKATSKRTQALWRCLCDCGREHVVKGWHLRSGESQSCGCLQRERAAAGKRTHGLSRHPAYGIWIALKDRCSPSYERSVDYYERGIRVCDLWETSFEAFWEDMGPTYKRGLTLDRINNDRGYEPGNCRWADYYTQANNNRRNRYIETPRGRMTCAQAARAFGISPGTIQGRLKRGITGDALVAPRVIDLDAEDARLTAQLLVIAKRLAVVRGYRAMRDNPDTEFVMLRTEDVFGSL